MSWRRKSLETLWFCLVLGWSGLRILFAEAYMVEYGIDIRWFIAVELVSSPILATASTRTVRALVARRLPQCGSWGLAAFAAYAAPDVYLLSAGQGVPWRIYALLIGVMAAAGIVGVVRLRRSLKVMRGSSPRIGVPHKTRLEFDKM